MRSFSSVAELDAAVGAELGVSDWVVLDQATLDTFAEVTGDHQWIHVEVERAASGPFGTTVAHGYLTLSLLPRFRAGIFDIVEEGSNDGVERFRLFEVGDVPGAIDQLGLGAGDQLSQRL